MRIFKPALLAGCICASVLAQDTPPDQTVLGRNSENVEELDYQSDAARLLKVQRLFLIHRPSSSRN